LIPSINKTQATVGDPSYRIKSLMLLFVEAEGQYCDEASGSIKDDDSCRAAAKLGLDSKQEPENQLDDFWLASTA